jgi:hypothetical protein
MIDTIKKLCQAFFFLTFFRNWINILISYRRDPSRGAEGARSEGRKETLRQKDCNLRESWKDPVF